MSAPRETRPMLDVSKLPDIAFAPNDLMWWGTLGFIVIEGWTLVLCAVVYLYLTQNFPHWPPRGTPRPSLLVPTIQMLLMAASFPFITWVQQRARRFELRPVKVGLAIAAVLNLAFVLIRCWELLRSLNVKWDSNAYGSAQWLILVMHGTLLLVEFVEVSGMALIFWVAPAEEKHFSDVYDLAFYWQFMILAWLPLYVLCFWLPRWM